MAENWVDIAGYEGLYQVSDMGRVRSLPHYVEATRWDGITQRMLKKGKVLTPGKKGSITLTKDKKRKGFTLYDLVAQAFVQNPYPDKYHSVIHINGNIKDCRASNLRWAK